MLGNRPPGLPSPAVNGDERVVRVGVLGCGNVGAALVALIEEQAGGHRGPHRPPPRGRQGGGAEPGPRARRPASRRAPHPRRRQRRRRPVDRRRRRGHRRHRAGPGAHPHGAEARQARGDGQQGAAGQRRRRALRQRRGGRARPPLRGGRGRRHPAHPGAAGEPCRRADPAGARHRERDHQLHPDEDERGRHRLLGRPVRGPAPRLRRAGPHGRHRGLRRRGQGRHHRQHRLRRPGRGRRRLPRGHQPHHARGHRGGRTGSATW